MYTALILDDEESGRKSLKEFVSKYCPEIEIIGVASSGEEAFDIICKTHPQILLLDIEISQASSKYNTSFDLLAKLPKFNFEVIFVTAYSHYALQAIQAHAIGYVLKPVNINDLLDATNSAFERLKLTGVNERLADLLAQVKSEKSHSNRLWIHSTKDIIPISTAEIIRLEAQGKYTDIYCDTDKKITSSKNLGEYIDLLDSTQFVKVHRSHVVNIDKILKYSKTDGGWVVTTDGKELPVSRNGRERLLKKL